MLLACVSPSRLPFSAPEGQLGGQATHSHMGVRMTSLPLARGYTSFRK